MALIVFSDPLKVQFDESLYSYARLNAFPETKAFAPKILAPRKALTGLVATRKEVDEKVVLAEVLVDLTWEAFEATVVVLEKKVEGAYADTPGKVKVIFKQTAARIFASSEATRTDQLDALGKVLAKPGLHADLKAPAKAFVEARKAWVDAVAAYDLAVDAAAEALENVNDGKRRLVAAMVEVHGLLEAKFPENRKKVESFFRKRSKKAAKAKDGEVKGKGKGKTDAKGKGETETPQDGETES